MPRLDTFENTLDNTVASGAQELKGLLRRRSSLFEQLTANGSAFAKQANLYILFRDVQSFGRFRRAHSFDVSQHENSAMLLGQRINGALEQ